MSGVERVCVSCIVVREGRGIAEQRGPEAMMDVEDISPLNLSTLLYPCLLNMHINTNRHTE